MGKESSIEEIKQERELLQKERDLFQRLLEINTQNDPKPFIEETLSLLVGLTRAQRGYLALFGDDSQDARWWSARGFSDGELREVRRRISGGIVAEAIATGQLIQSESAQDDPRFQGQQSVQLNQISAVLCAPFGVTDTTGILYLQDRTNGGAFTPRDRSIVELVTRYLTPAIERIRLKDHQEEDHTRELRRRIRTEGLIGRSRALGEVLSQLESAARFQVPVLLTGASGVGKTLFARAIHENSSRAKAPFLELNCAAIPENLFESELFGALPGAHSTATKKIIGKVAAAEGGTLFLDEIGELPMSVQGKLLQILQSKEYFPLGATKAEKANVRFVAATNVDLRAALEKKSFREDLFYRLGVLSVRIPSLAERKEDIGLLAQHFCESASRNYDLPCVSIAPSALLSLENAEWPGNVRQLAHVVEAAAIRAAMEGASSLERRHLSEEKEPSQPNANPTFQEATREFQKGLLLRTLNASQWNISEAARRLDITRTHVRHLVRAFGLGTSEPKR